MQGYTRRQLKEDKFVETAQGAAEWTAEHREPLIYGAIAVIVIVLATVGFLSWRNKQIDAANIALGNSMRVFSEPVRPAGAPAAPDTFASVPERAKAAQKQFKDVADKYSHTEAGSIAHYMEGVAALQAGDNSAGEQILKSVADSSNKNVAALAKMALANYYRSSNRASDATRIYKDLADHPTETVSKPAAQLAMAEIYESTDPQEATTLYQQIQKENANNAAGQVAAAKLNGAKGGAPNFGTE